MYNGCVMEEYFEKLIFQIEQADQETRRLIFSVCRSVDERAELGVAKWDEYNGWTIDIPRLPDVREETKAALLDPRFYDFFSILFIEWTRFQIGVLVVNNENGNLSFAIKPQA